MQSAHEAHLTFSVGPKKQTLSCSQSPLRENENFCEASTVSALHLLSLAKTSHNNITRVLHESLIVWNEDHHKKVTGIAQN